MQPGTTKNKARNTRGSVLLLSILVLAFIIMPAGIALFKYTLMFTMKSRYQMSVESASLLVADELSEIVVNDPHFGFVSLSNQPPIGKGTLAKDGEPCPITSINNLLATVRLDSIIAHNWNNADMCVLANKDYEHIKKTSLLLQSSLEAAIDPEQQKSFTDMNGNTITPYADAESQLSRNLQFADCGRPAQIRNLHISLGYLKDFASTNTPVPQPAEKAKLDLDSLQNGKYSASVDIPAFEKSYYFAATAPSTALSNAANFADADGKRFCSVIKVEADVAFRDPDFFNPRPSKNAEQVTWLHFQACAIPGDRLQLGPTGALLVMFPCGLKNLSCLNDLLHLDGGNVTQAYQASDGDLNADPIASTTPAQIEPWNQQDMNSARLAAAGLYCWLRSAGIRPRIDSASSALSENFRTALKSSNLIYEFDSTGHVVISSLPAMPLPLSVLSDRQVFVETGGQHHSLRCFNNVYALGTLNGGKHAGQPIEGDPINWCDLSYYGLSVDTAHREGKGTATGLSISGSASPKQSKIQDAISKDCARFQVNGNAVATLPRKTYYSGGLAVELSISEF